MDLIFLRHAKAEDRLPELLDEDRALTPQGQKQARAIAKGLSQFLKKAKKIEIWTSHAKRSKQTAAAVAKTLAGAKEQEYQAIYNGRLDELTAAWSASTADAIIIVGHEPYLSIWAKQLAEASLQFKKGAAAGFSLQSPDSAALKWYAAPKVLAGLGAKQ